MNLDISGESRESGSPERVSDLFFGVSAPPNRACLTFEGHTWTRAELEAETKVFADRLNGMNLKSGDLVAVIGYNSPRLVAALLAVWDCGLAVAPINPLLSESERDTVLELSGPAVVVAEAEIAAHVARRFSGTAVIELDEPARVLQAGTSAQSRGVGSDCALVLHTSGTTGTPKVAMLSHVGMLYALTSLVRFLTSRNQARRASETPNLIAFPLSHVAGLYNLLLAFRNGSEVILMRRFRVSDFIGIVEQRELRSVVLNPTMIHMLTESPDVKPEQLASLRFVRSGSAPLSASTARRFFQRFGIAVLNAYGQTETSGEVIGWSAKDVRDHVAEKLGSVGRPHPGVEIRFIDENLRDVPRGDVGELCVWTSSAIKSYLDGRPVDAVDGFVRTGDLGYVDVDGFVWLVGRRSDVIVCGGFKVLPEEVEEVLRQHAGVAEIMVGAVPDERLGESPHAFIVPRVPDGSLKAHELVDFARERLAHYKVPRAIHFVSHLPRNAVGKFMRSRAKDLVNAGTSR